MSSLTLLTTPLESGLCSCAFKQRKDSYHVPLREATDRGIQEEAQVCLFLRMTTKKLHGPGKDRRLIVCAGLQHWVNVALPGLLRGCSTVTLSTMHNPSVCLGAPSPASSSSSFSSRRSQESETLLHTILSL